MRRMSDRAYLISRLQAYKQIVENEIKDPVATQLLAETIQELSFEPREEDSLVVALLEGRIRELERKLNDNGNHWCNGLSRLYVLDKHDGRIHRIGDERHDGLWVTPEGEIHYHNLQNGDGGGVEDKEGYGYVILKTDDGSFSAPYCDIVDLRYEEQIRAYIKEQEEKE